MANAASTINTKPEASAAAASLKEGAKKVAEVLPFVSMTSSTDASVDEERWEELLKVEKTRRAVLLWVEQNQCTYLASY